MQRGCGVKEGRWECRRLCAGPRRDHDAINVVAGADDDSGAVTHVAPGDFAKHIPHAKLAVEPDLYSTAAKKLHERGQRLVPFAALASDGEPLTVVAHFRDH